MPEVEKKKFGWLHALVVVIAVIAVVYVAFSLVAFVMSLVWTLVRIGILILVVAVIWWLFFKKS